MMTTTMTRRRRRATTCALTAVATVSALFAFTTTPAFGQADPGDHGKIPQPAEPIRYDGHAVVRVQITSTNDLVTMAKISDDVWSHGEGIGPVDYRVAPEMMPVLEDSGLEFETLIPDIQPLIDAESVAAAGGGDGPWFDSYHTFDEIMTYLADLEALRPDIAERFVLGTSLEGRTIYGLKITGDTGGSKPGVLYHGCQHAREWITTMGSTYIADQLVRNYGTDPYLTELVDEVEIYVVPVVNPDGYEYSRLTDRMWRKNRRNNGGGSYGVDLNRNWAYGWGGEGSSGDPNSQIYRGPSAFSEPETQNLRDFMIANPNINGHIDIHSYSQLILQPWGWTINLPPDHDRFEVLGADMQEAMASLYGTNWVHGPSYTTIYPASGVAPDWTYGDQGAWGFTFELRDEGQYGFLLPPEQIIPASEECFAGAMVLADWVRTRLAFSLPEPLPVAVTPNVAAPVRIAIEEVNGYSYQAGSAKIYSRLGSSGSFTPDTMTNLGGGEFEGMVPPADCGDLVEFYFEAQADDGTFAHFPEDAPNAVFSTLAANSETVLADNFESDLGWSVVNIQLDDGAWERGVPAGDGTRGDPTSDYDGSGRAYLTGNRQGNSDVDGGPTRVTSPSFDLDGAFDSVIRYARWFYNDDGDADRLVVELSNNNGSTWTEVESVGGRGGWVPNEIRVSDYLAPTSTMRLRFSASDNPNDSITEAGLDAVEILKLSCDSGGEFTLAVSNLVAGQDATFNITEGTPNEASYLVYSLVGPGSTFVPALNVTLDLSSPRQAGGRIFTDANGDGQWVLRIPANSSGRRVWLQAAQFENTTNVVDSTVQ
ncbi:MAG: M14 family metallopeptidase [Phycisphaerales bacterium]